MTLSVKSDLSRPDGGYALLEGTGLAETTAVSVENRYTGEFLGADGKWGRKAHTFPVEPVPPDALRLGPDIVDRVPSDLQVAFRSQGGAELGTVFWADIVVSRDPVHGPSDGTVGDGARQATADQAAREAEAARLAAAERLRQVEADKARSEIEAQTPVALVAPPQPPPEDVKPKRRSRWGLMAGLLLLALAIAAGAVIATHPELFRKSSTPEAPPAPQPTPTPQPTPAPTPAPTPQPAPTPPVQPVQPPPPPPPARVDCSTFKDRLDGLSGASDDDKVKLGEDALRAGCGTEAFKAFEASDLLSNESAAWNLARFYDPNETAQVYRDAAAADAASAAVYYRLWRDRSARQAAALAKLCEANRGGGASLRRSCAR